MTSTVPFIVNDIHVIDNKQYRSKWLSPDSQTPQLQFVISRWLSALTSTMDWRDWSHWRFSTHFRRFSHFAGARGLSSGWLWSV